MKRILVIDDESWLREMVQLALNQRGYDVLEAGNGAIGIEVAQKELPDLILCDVNMEKVDGYHTLSSLRSQASTASIPFILMTGLADNAGMRHGMELGADDYLPKPFTIDALYAAVEARLKKVRAIHEQAEKKLADLRDNISLMLPHELRTPLNGILAYAEILATDAATLQPGEVAEMGQVIHDSSKRLERLIENFLIYAQLEIMGSDPQKMNALQKEETPTAAKVCQQRATEQARLEKREADLQLKLEEVTVPMSEKFFAKIVDEIVQNAFKFSTPGGKVEVELSNSVNSVLLSVSDRGIGFSTEHITKIGAYMQFDRKMQEQQGLGLGLTIAKRMTELHGGTLTIQSERGQLTTVMIKLPAAAHVGATMSNGSHPALVHESGVKGG